MKGTYNIHRDSIHRVQGWDLKWPQYSADPVWSQHDKILEEKLRSMPQRKDYPVSDKDY